MAEARKAASLPYGLDRFYPIVPDLAWLDRLLACGIRLAQLRLKDAPAAEVDPEAAAELEWVIALIGEVRALRSEMNVPASARIEMIVNGADAAQKAWLDRHGEAIGRLARLETLTVDAAVPAGSAQLVLGAVTAVLPLANVIDLEQEKQRLSKQIDKLAGEIRKIEGKLGNASFLSRAPEHVVEEQREQHEQRW